MDTDVLQDKLPSWPYDKAVRFSNQARVLMSAEPMVIRKPEFPQVATEVYFDIESDPTRGVDYLFGLLMRDTATGKDRYQSIIAKDPVHEKEAWTKFLDTITELEDFVIYHYAHYEQTVFDQLVTRYGAPSGLVQKFHEHAIDLHLKTVESVVLPLYFYTLKDIARFLGYEWADPEAGGAESVVWYDEWLKTGDASYLDRIIRYNEDDVRATMLLKDWLIGNKPHRQRERKEVLPAE
jgi:uncharacterized protein